MPPKKLGRGLDALLSGGKSGKTESGKPESAGASAQDGEAVIQIAAVEIFPSQFQPREGFDETAINELASSIRENGVIQPIIVRQQPEGYEIIAGERRWRAAQRAGLTQLPAIIRDVEDGRVLELALIENIQREDLNLIELARAFNDLLNKLGLKHEEVAAKVGKDRTTITNTIRLLELPDMIKDNIANGTLSMGHAKILLSLPNAAEQIKFAKKVISRGLTVRESEKLLRFVKDLGSKDLSKAQKAAHITDVEDRLRSKLSVKVSVREKGGRGRISIDFNSLDEFDRILEIIEK